MVRYEGISEPVGHVGGENWTLCLALYDTIDDIWLSCLRLLKWLQVSLEGLEVKIHG